MKNLRIGAIGAVLLMVAAACGGSTSSTADTIAFAAKAYPEAGPADCSAEGYYGFKRITSTDASTVVFELCAPDVAFIQKLALTNFVINDSGYLSTATADGSIVEKPNGTGPFKFKAWERGTQIVLERNADYWGQLATSGTAVFQWQAEAAARLIALKAGTADGIDNLAPTDIAASEADPIAHGCAGEAWYETNLDEAKALMAAAGYANGFKTTISYRQVDRGYLPVPAQVSADIQDQLKAIGINAEVKEVESTAFLDAASSGTLAGLHLLGWTGDYPDATNFLDAHFGPSVIQFGAPIDAITSALAGAGKTAVAAEREALYAEANNAIKANVPMIPVAHGGSAVAFAAGIQGAHSSPLGNEELAAFGSGGDDTFVWIQNGEPGGLYCADETDGESLRVCGQIGEGLFGFVTAGAETKPLLATACEASADLLTWTCTLRTGVKFHNGAAFDATESRQLRESRMSEAAPTTSRW